MSSLQHCWGDKLRHVRIRYPQEYFGVCVNANQDTALLNVNIR